jgi:protein phosphatase
MGEAIQIRDPQDCADRMIELALKGGGTDNVTVIIADVVDVDFGDDAPIVGGAAGDGSDEHHQGDSPAARARALTAPPPQPRVEQAPPPDPKAKRRRRLRWLLGILLTLVLLTAAAITTRYFVLRQYYVGVGGSNEVVIYQGVPGSILGIKLQRQAEGSCAPNMTLCAPLTLNQLQEAARAAVGDGVRRDNLGQARDYITTLRTNNQLNCTPPIASSPSQTVPPSPGAPAPGSFAAPTSSTGQLQRGGQAGVDCSQTPAPAPSGGN